MKTSFVLFATAVIIIFSCNSSGPKNIDPDKESYEIIKKDLKEKEVKHPENFLIVNAGDRHNLIGEIVVKGSISNKATVAVYKDEEVQLNFYSKTGTLLETDKETIYETIRPGESKNFKTKYFAPKGSDSVALKILGAKIAG